MDKRVMPLIRSLEAAGWRCEKKTDGWMCYPPDKQYGAVMIHKTPSDQNWIHQARRLLAKRGFEM
jgi:hypothetical protein